MFTALDWGGVRREWFELLSGELFDPERSGLFRRLQSDNQGLVSDVQYMISLSFFSLDVLETVGNNM